MTRITVRIASARPGVRPDGEPRPVRAAAGQRDGARGYGVYMVVIGGYDAYEVVAVYEDRRAARSKAREYNAAHARGSDIACCARVEEISFYPAAPGA